MALFTDAAVVTLDDLLQFETSLVQVASSHGDQRGDEDQPGERTRSATN